MINVLVTGSSGQLGQCFQKIAPQFSNLKFTFTTSEELDLCQFGAVNAYLGQQQFDFCINCAAYTNVEQAQSEREMAFLVNAEAVKNLAEVCEDTSCTLIHFSTDYVFDGSKDAPYSENDDTNPLNVYGASKLKGEEYLQHETENYLIFRTSWLYSEFGKNFFNFVKTKALAGESLQITTAQKGTPTNANDLARFVLEIISTSPVKSGVYHYSNEGEATWYDFAQEILENMNSNVGLERNDDFQTLATRPAYSVLSKEKLKRNFETRILTWEESLKTLF